jgi:cation diffusion facilitator family transporter
MGSEAYYTAVRMALFAIFIANVAVAALKGIYGLYTGSISMTTDGLHSFFDSASNIIGLVGIYMASRPPDKQYPYGHGKFETFASIGIAVLLFATCFQVLEASISRFLNPSTPEVTTLSFVIMGGTLVLNIGVSLYEYSLGKKLGSSILVADSMHTRSDIYASLGVILGLVAVSMGYPIADPMIALLITCLIVLTGIEIIRDSSKVLLDRAFIDEDVIKKIAESVDGVCSCHRIRTRGQPGKIYIDLHIGVDSSLSIGKAHDIAVAVEEMIEKALPGSEDVVVHLEPRDFCDIGTDGEIGKDGNVEGNVGEEKGGDKEVKQG